MQGHIGIKNYKSNKLIHSKLSMWWIGGIKKRDAPLRNSQEGLTNGTMEDMQCLNPRATCVFEGILSGVKLLK